MSHIALWSLVACSLASATAQDASQQDGAAAVERNRFSSAADYSAEHSGRAVLIMRDGEVLFERYDNGWSADRAHPLASGTKSFTGVLAMAAVQDGLITLDELVADTITEWKNDPSKSQITVRHLLTLSSGLAPNPPELAPGGAMRERAGLRQRVGDDNELANPSRKAADTFKAAIAVKSVAKPGQRFMYGSTHYFAFGEFLERKLRASSLTTKTYLEYLQHRYFDDIGLNVGAFGLDGAGHPNLPGGCRLTARDWVKFGEFVRLGGAVKQPDGTLKQVIDPKLIAECFKPSHANPSYGLTWWLRLNAEATLVGEGAAAATAADGDQASTRREEFLREHRTGTADAALVTGVVDGEGRPVKVYMAAGLGKQRLYVLPNQRMVIVRFAQASAEGRRFDDAEFIARVLGVNRGN